MNKSYPGKQVVGVEGVRESNASAYDTQSMEKRTELAAASSLSLHVDGKYCLLMSSRTHSLTSDCVEELYVFEF